MASTKRKSRAKPKPEPAAPPARPSIWGRFPLPEAEITTRELWTVRLHAQRVANEARFAVEQSSPTDRAARTEEAILEPETLPPSHPEAEAPAEARAPEPLEWQRFAFRRPPSELTLLPTLPDRPLILATDGSFDLRPGASVRIYVTVPAWMSIQTLDTTPDVLLEIPTVVLSSTWFGSFTAGELCYWIPTAARRDLGSVELAPHLVICPIQIQNQATEPLMVDKLCLRVRHLTIFRAEGHLWADETKITYQGGGDFSRLRWSGKAPAESANAALLSAPREPMRTGLSAWTFEQLRDLQPWGSR